MVGCRSPASQAATCSGLALRLRAASSNSKPSVVLAQINRLGSTKASGVFGIAELDLADIGLDYVSAIKGSKISIRATLTWKAAYGNYTDNFRPVWTMGAAHLTVRRSKGSMGEMLQCNLKCPPLAGLHDQACLATVGKKCHP